jgi:hypothetical protein
MSHTYAPEPASSPAPPARRKLLTSVIVGLLSLAVYSANFRSISAGDTYPARYLPFAIWHWHTVLLDPIVDITAQGRTPMKPRRDKGLARRVDPQEAFWIIRLNTGHAVSLYPLLVPVLVSPLYLPAVAYLDATGWDQQQFDRIARIMEKVSASLLAAISVALFYLLLLRRIAPHSALLLTAAYAFGTTTWVISSQGLWQHGLAELLVICSLLLLTGQCTRSRVFAAGLVLGLIACNRPPDLLIAAALGAYGLWWAKRFAPLFVASAVLPAVPLLAYNLGIVGHYAGAYGLVGDTSYFRHNLITGLAGLLFSPTKGLLVFSPFLIFLPFCLIRMLRDDGTRWICLAALVAVILQLLVYAGGDWRQGGSWGPRWLTSIVPLLVWMLPPVFTEFRTAARALFVAAVGAAIVIGAIGAFWYTGTSNIAVYASATGENPMAGAWKWRNAPFIAELRHARAPFELTTSVRGFLDVFRLGYGAGGREIDLLGWAVADGHPPAEVAVLGDGRVVASTSAFGPRPDVSRTLGAKGVSGWRVVVPGSPLTPGKHAAAVLARAHPGGDTYLIAERHFEVQTGLAGSAHGAADTLASRQQDPGYWLTSFTGQPRFEHPGVEMNTYLPAVMLDLLKPIANKAGLETSVERARQFLTQQIEATGLVRYHGLPDAPTIGTLGCAITPDADDTALVWRIAPSARHELLPPALRMINAYRTPGGLYRTWLSAKERYQCIDPGSDPDPADIGIQMHVFMMLATTDPPAANALCNALQRSVKDERNWVYYKIAPLIPILRLADLRESGCSLYLPPPHQNTSVPGQELWISAAHMLDGERSRHGRPSDGEVRELLQEIAKDDFQYARQSPPLLYHNDQTASVPRFYWSEEFGYALWLRLYFELHEQAGGGTK